MDRLCDFICSWDVDRISSFQYLFDSIIPVRQSIIGWGDILFYFPDVFLCKWKSHVFDGCLLFFFATIIAVVFFSDSLQNKITLRLLFVIMNYACKTAMTGIALARVEQTLPRELINYRIVMDPWSQMMACILFVLSLWFWFVFASWGWISKIYFLYSTYLFPLTVMISVIIISHKNIGFGSAAAGTRSFIFILQYFCFLNQSFLPSGKKYSFGYVRRESHR